MEEQKFVPIKTLADFKRAIKMGTKIGCIHHQHFNGFDEQKKAVYKEMIHPVREVSIVQTNTFALKTTRSDNKVVDSYCEFPKAKNCKIENNKITILEKDMRQFKGGIVREGNPDYDSLPEIPILTYWVIAE